ncbi:MAG: FG-GAP repeat domain-containing protein [Candidatus Helarchaeota archaeon]
MYIISSNINKKIKFAIIILSILILNQIVIAISTLNLNEKSTSIKNDTNLFTFKNDVNLNYTLTFNLSNHGGYMDRPVIYDIDNDGKNEIICEKDEYNWSVIECNSDNKEWWDENYVYDNSRESFQDIAIGDLNNDSIKEIITSSNNGNVTIFDNYSMFLRNKFSYTHDFSSVSNNIDLATGDVDNDSEIELCIGNLEGYIYLIHYNKNSKIYEEDIGSGFYSGGHYAWSLRVGDTDNDGVNELIMKNSNGEVRVYG